MKYILQTIILFVLTGSISHAEVYQLFDYEKNCNRFLIPPNAEKTQQLRSQGATLINKNIVYGFSLENLKIDFNKKEIRLDVKQRIALARNKPLLQNVKVSESLQKIEYYSNMLNHDFLLIQNICIREDGEITEAKSIVESN